MPTLAARLLDAQVAWVLADLERDLPAVVAREVDAALAVAARLPLRDVGSPEAVTALVTEVLATVPASTAGSTFVAVLAQALHDGPAGEHRFGDLVGREHVEALTDAALARTDGLRAALDDLSRSPAVAAVVTRFMTRVVAEVVQTNRAVAEKVPGLGSLFTLGAGAAGRVAGATQLDALLGGAVGGAAGLGAGVAVRRLNAVVVDTLADPGTRAAVLEVHDLYADRPLRGLAGSADLEEVEHVAGLLQDVVVDAAASPPVLALVAAVVEGFWATYADHPVGELVADLGLDRDRLVHHATALVGPVVAALRDSGELEALVRARLAPFWESPEAAALLEG